MSSEAQILRLKVSFKAMFTISDPYPVKPPSRSASEAAAKRAAKEAEATMRTPVRCEAPSSHRLSDHSLRPPHARPAVDDCPPHGRRRPPAALYGSLHTRMCVSSLAEAVAPS